ncbi:hypothetical protein [Microbulbifer hydrolyticus]|uniref:Uncharacterized protein n=1 Tax=Microbulbifer hydrolyticus TaxID=48074 RepID=A0AA89PIR0_9GAMM|nr:hypothetical protein [Microbulbifer hydrolyticus]MBB5212241.1 hypothetical protein [Microbulbifer hydrolyticus]
MNGYNFTRQSFYIGQKTLVATQKFSLGKGRVNFHARSWKKSVKGGLNAALPKKRPPEYTIAPILYRRIVPGGSTGQHFVAQF